MKPLDFPMMVDENIHPSVVAHLVSAKKDVRTVGGEALLGASDRRILSLASSQGRVVITHDSDFGTLAVYAGEPYVGIIYLRPGHISPSFVVQMLEAIESSTDDVTPPFVLVAERRGESVRIRTRDSRA